MQSLRIDTGCAARTSATTARSRGGRTRPRGLRPAASRGERFSHLGGGGRVAGRIARGEVRLYQFAPPDKTRPVVILTRDSALPYLSAVTIAPITSTVRGVPSEVRLDADDGMKAPCAVNLHNVITVS